MKLSLALKLLWTILTTKYYLGLLQDCVEAVKEIQLDYPSENGEFKRARAYKIVCRKRNLPKSNRNLNLHLELAVRMIKD